MSGRKNNPPCFVSLISASLCDAPPSCTTAAFGHILSCIVRTCGLYTSHILSGLCGAMAPRGPQPPPAEARYLDVLRRVLPRRVGDTAKAYSRSALRKIGKKNGRGCAVENAARACPCGVLGASQRDSPSFPPGGCLRRRLSATVWINSFLQEKLNRNFGALFLCRRAAGCRRFPDDAVRCRACGACGIREVQNAGRRIVNSELFFYLCNRIVGFSRLDGPIAQSVRAADS